MVIYFITNCIHIIQKNIMCFAPMAYFTGRMHKRETTKGDCDSYVKVDEEKRLTDILDCSTGDYRFCTIFSS